MVDIEDLENVILGVVYKQGSCTPYAVRKEFEQSRSPHFSSSPGSIYPIIARLEERKLLKSRDDATGKRKRKMYSVTAAGKRELKKWLTPPLPAKSVGMTLDPLRTRAFFLGILNASERGEFFEQVAGQLEAEIADARLDESKYKEAGDVFSWIAAKGGVDLLKARLKWLKFAAKELESND